MLAASAVVACRDSTAPPDGVRVSLNVVTGTPRIELDDDGSTAFRCGVSLEAVASGKGSATWTSGALLLYMGRDRSTPMDTLHLSADQLASMFEAPGMAADRTRRVTIFVAVYVPFEITFAFDYEDDATGVVRTAETSFRCGPDVPATGRPPVITELTVSPPVGLEAGQSFGVEVTAQGEVGIVALEVTLSGACAAHHTQPVLFEKSVTRTFAVAVPIPCRTDRPLDIEVTAVDGSLDVATRWTSRSLWDRTPPTISPRFYPANGGPPLSWLAGILTHGDSIAVNFNAEDIGGVGALRWEVLPSGAQGIIALTPGVPPSGRDVVKIPVRDSWGTGPVQLRLWARDFAGLESTSYTSAPGAVQIVAPAATSGSSAAPASDVGYFAIEAGAVRVVRTRTLP